MSDQTSWPVPQGGTGGIQPDEAAGALAEVEQRHRQIVDLMAISWWYWWVIAALMVGLAVAVDTRQRAALAVAIPLFVVGVLLTTGAMVVGRWRRARPRQDLIDPGGVFAILILDAVVIGVSLGLAFTLRARGVDHPATWGVLAGAVLMVAGGPFLNRLLRRRMLQHGSGGR
jgi:hypothetical protein